MSNIINSVKIKDTGVVYDIQDTDAQEQLQGVYTKTETNALLDTKQPVIDAGHKLNADYVDDTNANHKFVTNAQKVKLDNAYGPAYVGKDTSTNILAKTSNQGVWVGSDTGYWYYWDGSQYTDGGTYQATQVANGDAFKPFETIPDNANLNDYIIIGSYWLPNGNQTNRPTNFTNGCLLVFTTKDTISNNDVVFQMTIKENGVSYIRRKYGTTWTTWELNNAFGKLTQVETNFNNYVNEGSYWIPSGTITNKPNGFGNGCLIVYKQKDTSNNLNVILQVAFDQTGTKTFMRRNYNNTWTDWCTLKAGFYDKGVVSTDFNNYINDGSYFIQSGVSVANKPDETSWNGLLLVFSGTYDVYTFTYQIALDQNGKCYSRRYSHTGSTWTNWVDWNENNKSSVIYGKKWYACGDSFTAQGYTESDAGYGTDSILPSGKYQGMNAVYPYYIGNRTDCNVQNVAQGGMSISYQTGHTNSFTYNNAYQTLIGADADIITLYFGINDTNYDAPLGTIDSTDISTFYGAWNTVISWILENRPNAKLGVIISNGMGDVGTTPASDYVNAEISICQKWGVPYLNIDGDATLPLVIRTVTRPNLSATRKQQFLEDFSVNYPTNTHPNYKAQENESYMIQQFLERL